MHRIFQINAIAPLNQSTNVRSRTMQNPRYCSVCAQRGHIAEQCRYAHRYMRDYAINPTEVASYRPIYKIKDQQQKNTNSKYTIFSSPLHDFSFNYGNEVHETGNRIYARFRQAVNLVKLNDQNDESVEILESSLKEYIVPDSSFDDDADELEIISDNENDLSHQNIIQIDENEGSKSIGNSSDDVSIVQGIEAQSKDEIDEDAIRKSNELELAQLDRQMQTLSDLKQKILQNDGRSGIEAKERDNETDSNYSFSEFHEESAIDSNNVSTTESMNVLPDYIPLRSQSPVLADTTTDSIENENEKSDSKIYLTKEHCDHLNNQEGSRFLQNTEKTYNVSVRMEMTSVGNVLFVNAFPKDQAKYHDDLINYLTSIKVLAQVETQQISRKPVVMSRFIRDSITKLENAEYDRSATAYVVNTHQEYKQLFRKISQSVVGPSKKDLKKATQLRLKLNRILCGRFGLFDGKKHLNALKDVAKQVNRLSCRKVPDDLYDRVCEHYTYIFSGRDHGFYDEAIELLVGKKKPIVLDDLRGVNYKLHLDGMPIVSATPTPNIESRSNIMTTAASSNPSSIDIQINVSNPSTSYNG